MFLHYQFYLTFVDISTLPAWFGSPIQDPLYSLSEISIPEELDDSIAEFIKDKKRRKLLIERLLRLFSMSSLPDDHYEKVLGSGTLECTEKERIVWMSMVNEMIPISESPLSHLRYIRLMQNPDFFLL